jgi:hypothetical protein
MSLGEGEPRLSRSPPQNKGSVVLTDEQLTAEVSVLIEAHPFLDSQLAEILRELLAPDGYDTKVCSRVADAFRVNGLYLDPWERDNLRTALGSGSATPPTLVRNLRGSARSVHPRR